MNNNVCIDGKWRYYHRSQNHVSSYRNNNTVSESELLKDLAAAKYHHEALTKAIEDMEEFVAGFYSHSKEKK